jgi:hypothetical protein
VERGVIRGKQGSSSIERGVIHERGRRKVRNTEIFVGSMERKVLVTAISVVKTGRKVSNVEQSMDGASARRRARSNPRTEQSAKC